MIQTLNIFSGLYRLFRHVSVFCCSVIILGSNSVIHVTTLHATTSVSTAPIFSYQDRFHPVVSRHGMVVSQEKEASQVGADILRNGGNAMDAAVAMGFALSATLPRAGNLGGGGFMMIYDAKTKRVRAIDYREKAPLKATKDMFLDVDGNPDDERSRYSSLASGVPGTVAGLCYVLDKYGTMSLKKVIKPAIHLAKRGFVVTPEFQDALNYIKPKMQQYPESMRVFFTDTQDAYPIGSIFRQPDLAKSLTLIKKLGKDGFYKGQVAKLFVDYMAMNGGLITHQDLDAYTVVERQPIEGDYRGYKVYAMPPPSSGGVHLVQMLNMLEGYNIKEMGHNSADTIHLLSETMKRAYADRSKYLGDPDFNRVPISQLTSKAYASQLRDQFNLDKITPSTTISPGEPVAYNDQPETTQFTVMDKYGNIVSNTYTLNFSFGNAQVIPGTGILLNNEMDDFTTKPGAANAYGLIGGELNSIEPEKRMLSSMTPTIVLKDGTPFLATGSPGGSRIITTVLQIVMNVIDHGMTVSEATAAVRVHHQWFPDTLRIENGLNKDTRVLLESKGHQLNVGRSMGATQSILFKNGLFFGATDPRRSTGAVVGVTVR